MRTLQIGSPKRSVKRQSLPLGPTSHLRSTSSTAIQSLLASNSLITIESLLVIIFFFLKSEEKKENTCRCEFRDETEQRRRSSLYRMNWPLLAGFSRPGKGISNPNNVGCKKQATKGKAERDFSI